VFWLDEMLEEHIRQRGPYADMDPDRVASSAARTLITSTNSWNQLFQPAKLVPASSPLAEAAKMLRGQQKNK
jgi:hypothetical protein